MRQAERKEAEPMLSMLLIGCCSHQIKWSAVLVLVVLGPCLNVAVGDLQSDRAYLAKLLDAGKFDQAELVCRESLAKSDLDAETRAGYTCDLLRVLSERARRADPASSAEYWAQAHQVGGEYLRQHTNSPRSVLVRLQMELSNLARAEQMLGLVNATPADLQRTLQQVSRDLKQLGTETDERLRRDNDNPNEDGYLNRKALRAIRAAIRQHRARALLMLAAAGEARETDRTYACAQARTELEKISPGDLSETAWWRSRVSLATCHRLRKDWESAAKIIEEVRAAPSAAALQPLLDAEVLRGAMAREQWSQVRSAVAQSPSATRPELGFARFEALLRLAQVSQSQGDLQLAKSLQAKAAEALPAIETKFGSWWRRRAEKMLLSTHQADVAVASSEQGDLAAAIARSLLARGEPAAAANKLLAAAQAAVANGERDAAERYAGEAAAIVWDARLWGQAKQNYLALANNIATTEIAAAESHLMAVRSAAQLAREDANSIEAYQSLLDEHQRRWPAAPTAHTASLWRAKLAEQQQAWDEAAKSYLQALLQKDSDQAQQAIGRCYRQAVSEGLIDKDEAVAAAQRLLAVPEQNRRPASLLAAVDLYLEHTYQPSIPLAARVETQRNKIPVQSSQRQQAALLLAELHARNGDPTAAIKLVDQLETGWEPAQLLATLARLSTVNSRKNAALRRKLVERALDDERQLSEPDASELAAYHAAALLETGDAKAAVGVARTHAEANERNVAAQLLFIRCLLATHDSKLSREAERRAGQLVKQLTQGSDDWFRAKLLLAESLWAVGEQARARKLLQLTTTLYPDWGGIENYRHFEELTRRLGSPPHD